MVNEDASGLCKRLSEMYPALGASRLGRRNRWSKKFGSSRVTDEEDAIGVEEDDGGRAKSLDDVGKVGRGDALGIDMAKDRLKP